MGIFTENKTVKDIFGVDEDGLKAKLEAGEKAQADVTALQAAKAETDRQLAEVNRRLAALSAAPPQREEEQPESKFTSVVDNEDQAFSERMTPLYLQTLELKADIVLDRVSKRFADWNKFEKEISELLKNTPVQARQHEGTVENAYYIAVGKKRPEIVRDTLAQKGEYFMESGTNTGNNGTTENKTAEQQLSKDEIAMAAKYGITPEKWLEQKKGIQYV